MSIRNLDYLFKPRSIALIGASRQPLSVGNVVARNLFDAGFRGPIMPVNPNDKAVEGVLAYPDVASLPLVPDLAVIATPPETIPALIDELGGRGTRAAVVISSGFSLLGEEEGDALKQAMLDAARPHTLRILGPNCLGILAPAIGLNTSVAPLSSKPGHLAFIAQSGAMVATVLDWAAARGIGFSHFISLGDMVDVDFGDLLDFLGGETDVRGILLYMETVTDARKFMSAARATARIKPVIVVKSGRYPASARAVSSHTGGTTGQDAVYDAAFRRAGMLRVQGIDELFGTVETLGFGRVARGDRLTILTNGGGVGVLTTDALLEHGGRLAELSPEMLAALDAFLPRDWSHANPVDITRNAPADRYGQSLKVLLGNKDSDAILVLHSPSGMVTPVDAARAVVATLKGSNASVLTCWLGETAGQEARQLLTEHRIPTYPTPERATRAFMHMVTYHRNQEMLTQTPPSVPEDFSPDRAAAQQIVANVLAQGRSWLTEPEAMGVLLAYAIPVVSTHVAQDPTAAAAAATIFGGPVVLKILSPDILSKTAVDGIILDIRSPAGVQRAAQSMHERVKLRAPQARLDGFTVQPMIFRPDGVSLAIRVVEDSQFGPVISFCPGGRGAECLDDVTVALPPLNMHLARDVIRRTRIVRMLDGGGDQPAAAIDQVALTLIKVAQLVIDLAEVVELVIDPLVGDRFGVIALDAKIRIAKPTRSATQRLAIRPYPKELEETLDMPNGRTFLLRPVLPEDEPAFQDLFSKLSPRDVRMRFFAPKKALTHPLAARMTQIDYDREMALVLAEPGTPGKSPIFGAVHVSADADNERAEYSIMLQSDMVGLGLGPLLMRRIIDYARRRGLKEIYGEVLRENRPMLKICDLLKFQKKASLEDPGTIEVRLTL